MQSIVRAKHKFNFSNDGVIESVYCTKLMKITIGSVWCAPETIIQWNIVYSCLCIATKVYANSEVYANSDSIGWERGVCYTEKY